MVSAGLSHALRRAARLVAMGAVLATSALAPGATTFSADLALDPEGARTLGFGIDQRGERWGWHLDFSHGSAPADGLLEAFSGDDLGFGVGWRGERYSLAADWSRWQDSTGVESELLSVDAAWQGDDWRFALLPRAGRATTVLPDPASLDVVRRSYDRCGLGLDLERAGEGWALWFGFASWDYSPTLDIASNPLAEELRSVVDLGVLVPLIRAGQPLQVNNYLNSVGADDLQQVLAAQGLAGLTRVVRYEFRRARYAASLRSFALGLADPVLKLGFEREVGSGAWGLEFEQVEIPIDDLQSSSYTLRLRWPLNEVVEVEVATGFVDTERYGGSVYAGFTLRAFLD